MQKPCYIYNQDLNFHSKRGSAAYLDQKFSYEHYEIVNVFNRSDFHITDEQLEICRYVYGGGQTKTPEQLQELLLPCVK